MRSSARLRLGAWGAASVVLMLALGGAPQAQPQDQDDEPYDNGYRNGYDDRRSTWEPNTSLVFKRYLEPFPRVPSARACRNRCVGERHCTGWTYYDPNFREAGDISYRLQGVCVLGDGLKDRKFGSMPGRTSGVVRPLEQEPEDECCSGSSGGSGPR
jgi:hypothetical protein